LNKPQFFIEPDIYYHIGLAYCNIEKFEKSIYPYGKCIELVPSEIDYIHERAKAYQMIEDHENAIIDFSTVILKNQKNAHAHFRRAFSYKAMKNFA
jgi:tetratricopeptide (TPR) repeat protein